MNRIRKFVAALFVAVACLSFAAPAAEARPIGRVLHGVGRVITAPARFIKNHPGPVRRALRGC